MMTAPFIISVFSQITNQQEIYHINNIQLHKINFQKLVEEITNLKSGGQSIIKLILMISFFLEPNTF